MKQRKSTLQTLFHCLLVLLVSASANALNLGDINLKSAPDQPLEAEIQLLGVAADEQDSLSVGLADVAGFRWAGIEWSPVLNQLQFELKRAADGTNYIRIHSSEVVQAPLLHFLLKVAWSRGRLFREYTLELDTPLYLSGEQPGDAVAQTFATPDIQRDWEAVKASVRGNRNYGPVIEYDTLWTLARELRPDTSVSIQQMMLALLRTNPDAFSYGNINWLRKDAVLWMPNDFELQALTKPETFAEVLVQNNFWRTARGYATVDAGLQTAPGTVEVDGGLRLVAVAEEDLEGNGTAATVPGGSAEAETLVLANEQVEELSLENVELEDKLTEAETIIEDLRRLVELKDDELAALQGQALSEQAEPGPDLLERLSSVYDSTTEMLSGPKINTAFESAYSLARDYWYIALALLAALVLGGFMLGRRKDGDEPEEEVSTAVAGSPDLAEALAIEKAVFPDDDNIDDADTAAEEMDLEEETEVDEADITDDIETGEDDSPDDMEVEEDDTPDVMEAEEDDIPDDMEAEEDDLPDDMEAEEDDLPDDMEAEEDDTPDDIEVEEDDTPDDMEAADGDAPDDMEAAEDDIPDEIEAEEGDITDVAEIGEPESADPAIADTTDELTSQEQDMGDEQEEGYQEVEDMVQNKLELARAYLELDDGENVRSILQEVLSEGNAAQREEARQLLEQATSG